LWVLLAFDTGDFDISIVLTVAGFLLVMFTTPEFHDFDLFRTAMGLDGRGNLATLHKRGANVDLVTIGDHQNLVDLDSSAFFGIQFFNATQIAFGNPVLLSTCTDYSVHGVFSKSLTEKARILTVIRVRGKPPGLNKGVFLRPLLDHSSLRP
jgi:hypothetical protein